VLAAVPVVAMASAAVHGRRAYSEVQAQAGGGCIATTVFNLKLLCRLGTGRDSRPCVDVAHSGGRQATNLELALAAPPKIMAVHSNWNRCCTRLGSSRCSAGAGGLPMPMGPAALPVGMAPAECMTLGSGVGLRLYGGSDDKHGHSGGGIVTVRSRCHAYSY
jgi:hypothetical protein